MERKEGENEEKRKEKPFSTNNKLPSGCFTNNSKINGVSIEFHKGSTSWTKGGVCGKGKGKG